MRNIVLTVRNPSPGDMARKKITARMSTGCAAHPNPGPPPPSAEHLHYELAKDRIMDVLNAYDAGNAEAAVKIEALASRSLAAYFQKEGIPSAQLQLLRLKDPAYRPLIAAFILSQQRLEHPGYNPEEADATEEFQLLGEGYEEAPIWIHSARAWGRIGQSEFACEQELAGMLAQCAALEEANASLELDDPDANASGLDSPATSDGHVSSDEPSPKRLGPDSLLKLHCKLPPRPAAPLGTIGAPDWTTIPVPRATNIAKQARDQADRSQFPEVAMCNLQNIARQAILRSRADYTPPLPKPPAGNVDTPTKAFKTAVSGRSARGLASDALYANLQARALQTRAKSAPRTAPLPAGILKPLQTHPSPPVGHSNTPPHPIPPTGALRASPTGPTIPQPADPPGLINVHSALLSTVTKLKETELELALLKQAHHAAQVQLGVARATRPDPTMPPAPTAGLPSQPATAPGPSSQDAVAPGPSAAPPLPPGPAPVQGLQQPAPTALDYAQATRNQQVDKKTFFAALQTLPLLTQQTVGPALVQWIHRMTLLLSLALGELWDSPTHVSWALTQLPQRFDPALMDAYGLLSIHHRPTTVDDMTAWLHYSNETYIVDHQSTAYQSMLKGDLQQGNMTIAQYRHLFETNWALLQSTDDTLKLNCFMRGLRPALAKQCFTDERGMPWTSLPTLIQYAAGKEYAYTSSNPPAKASTPPVADRPVYKPYQRRQDTNHPTTPKSYALDLKKRGRNDPGTSASSAPPAHRTPLLDSARDMERVWVQSDPFGVAEGFQHLKRWQALTLYRNKRCVRCAQPFNRAQHVRCQFPIVQYAAGERPTPEILAEFAPPQPPKHQQPVAAAARAPPLQPQQSTTFQLPPVLAPSPAPAPAASYQQSYQQPQQAYQQPMQGIQYPQAPWHQQPPQPQPQPPQLAPFYPPPPYAYHMQLQQPYGMQPQHPNYPPPTYPPPDLPPR